MSAPALSVVMPAHNAAAHIERGLSSVLAQRGVDLELVVVDDGSTDDTAARVAACGDARVRLVSQPKSGVSRARNRGLQSARGEWVAFLDSDDEWEPDCLVSLLTALRACPDAAVAYCGWQNVGLPGPRGEPWVPPELEGPDKLLRLLENCPWPIHAALARRTLVLEAGGFPEQYSHAEDYSLWLNLVAFRATVRVPRVLAYYHWHDGPRASDRVAEMVRQRRLVLRDFVAAHPEVTRQLGEAAVREQVDGRVLRDGFEACWRGDLAAARPVFRIALTLGLGTPAQRLRMAAAYLPLGWHRRLLRLPPAGP